MFVSLNSENRICVTSDFQEFVVNGFKFDFPQDFDFNKQEEYQIINGQLIHNPLPKVEEPEEPSLQEQIDDLTLVVAEMVGA